MPISEVIRLALSALGVNKLRSALTMLGITIGVFSVISVMTAVSALQGSIESGLSFLGSNTYQFGKWPIGIHVGGRDMRKYANRPNITLAEGRRFERMMAGQAKLVSLKCFESGVQASFHGQKTNPNIQFCGSDENFLALNQFSLDYGRNLSPEDVDLGRSVAVIGKGIVERLFPYESPLNKRINVAGNNYIVVGVLADKESAFGQNLNNFVLAPISTFLNNRGSRWRSVQIAVQAPSRLLYNDTLDRGIGSLRIIRRLKPEDENNFEIYSNDSLVSAFNNVSRTIRVGVFIISLIALVAAGVGIMNIMLVSVTERTREIGIRKSIGAKKHNILNQFLIESVTLSVIGGGFGVVLGIIAGNGVAIWLKASLVFPVGWVVAGLLVCGGIGVGFGLYPAWKAASLDPIEALRYE